MRKIQRNKLKKAIGSNRIQTIWRNSRLEKFRMIYRDSRKAFLRLMILHKRCNNKEVYV